MFNAGIEPIMEAIALESAHCRNTAVERIRAQIVTVQLVGQIRVVDVIELWVARQPWIFGLRRLLCFSQSRSHSCSYPIGEADGGGLIWGRISRRLLTRHHQYQSQH